jgi:hypothetical protein
MKIWLSRLTAAFGDLPAARAGMVRKNRCCIATVQIDDLPSDLKSANSLFRMMV